MSTPAQVASDDFGIYNCCITSTIQYGRDKVILCQLSPKIIPTLMIEIKQSPLKGSKAQELYDTRPFYYVYNYEKLLCDTSNLSHSQATTLEDDTPHFILSHSNLHHALNTVVPKQNCMVQGKYKKARLYLFESDNFLVASQCETGDKGSTWFIGYKDNRKIPYFHIQNLCPEEKKELTMFFRSLMYHILKGHEPSLQDTSKRHPSYVQELFKEAQAQELHDTLQEKIPSSTSVDRPRMKI